MKVAINAWFHNKIHTGSGQYLRYLVPALLKIDSQVEIVLVVPDDGGSRNEPLSWPGGVTVEQVPVRPGHLGKVWFEQYLFPQKAVQSGADLAHVPYFGSALTPRLPTVVTVHDLIPLVLPEYRGGSLVRLYTSLVAAAAANANLILADSEASRRDILTHLGIPPERVRTVYLAPAPQFEPLVSWDQVEQICAKYDLPEPYVLYMGGYDVRKNITALLHAWTYVARGLGDTVKLVLAGRLPQTDTPFFPDPLKIARKLDIADYIVTPGWIAEEDKPLLFGAARVFVYPSRYEGFGLPVLEAMACATPVVTTNAASLPELVGDDAFLIDPDDTRHLASPIIALSIQEDTHNDMANRAYDRAAQFSWQKTARETLQAYRDVLAAR